MQQRSPVYWAFCLWWEPLGNARSCAPTANEQTALICLMCSLTGRLMTRCSRSLTVRNSRPRTCRSVAAQALPTPSFGRVIRCSPGERRAPTRSRRSSFMTASRSRELLRLDRHFGSMPSVDTSARSGSPGGHLDAHVGTAKQSRMVDRPGTAWLTGHPARTSLVERHPCCRGEPPYFKSSSDAFPHRQ
jgi:hypothetical protein